MIVRLRLPSKRDDCRIGPAFRWAQSPDTVFIEQKFSHKWDTPATLGCKRDKLSIAGHELSFHATCSKHRKRFTLDLDLFRPIDGKVRCWRGA